MQSSQSASIEHANGTDHGTSQMLPSVNEETIASEQVQATALTLSDPYTFLDLEPTASPESMALTHLDIPYAMSFDAPPTSEAMAPTNFQISTIVSFEPTSFPETMITSSENVKSTEPSFPIKDQKATPLKMSKISAISTDPGPDQEVDRTREPQPRVEPLCITEGSGEGKKKDVQMRMSSAPPGTIAGFHDGCDTRSVEPMRTHAQSVEAVECPVHISQVEVEGFTFTTLAKQLNCSCASINQPKEASDGPANSIERPDGAGSSSVGISKGKLMSEADVTVLAEVEVYRAKARANSDSHPELEGLEKKVASHMELTKDDQTLEDVDTNLDAIPDGETGNVATKNLLKVATTESQKKIKSGVGETTASSDLTETEGSSHQQSRPNSNQERRPAVTETLRSAQSASAVTGLATAGTSMENPVVIDDTREDPQRSEHSDKGDPRRTPKRVRKRRQTADGVVMWGDPTYEARSVTRTDELFALVQAEWMKVRELPPLKGSVIIKRYDGKVKEVEAKSDADGTICHEDVVGLANRYKFTSKAALKRLANDDDKQPVRNLRKLLNRLCESVQMSEMIIDHPMEDDEKDVDYRPAKRRRRDH